MEITIPTLKGRIHQVEARYTQEGLSALVVYASGSGLGFASQTHGYMRYLCDWDARNQTAVLILQPGREPILLVPGRSPQLFAKEIMWFQDIRATPQSEFGKEIVRILAAVLPDGAKVGYVGKCETPVPLYDTLREDLRGITLVEANHLIDRLRTVKDRDAIGFHRRSARVCDDLFETFRQTARAGRPVYQIQADLEHRAKYAGCEYASSFLSIGPVADRPRYAKRECLRVPQEGDHVLLAVFLMLDGHWGHAIRTGCLGKPGRPLEKAYQIAREMQSAALDRFSPGGLLHEVWQASEAVLAQYYPDARSKDWYWLKTGHSLGLDYSDPILSAVFPVPSAMGKKPTQRPAQQDSRVRIEPGMLFEIHPNIFIPDQATAAIGDMVLATETGHERLTRFPRELMVL